jgi:hypothetical protein
MLSSSSSSLYRLPIPVDHIYYIKYSHGETNKCRGGLKRGQCGNCVPCCVERLLRVCRSSPDNDVKGVHILCESHQLDSDRDTKNPVLR